MAPAAHLWSVGVNSLVCGLNFLRAEHAANNDEPIQIEQVLLFRRHALGDWRCGRKGTGAVE